MLFQSGADSMSNSLSGNVLVRVGFHAGRILSMALNAGEAVVGALVAGASGAGTTCPCAVKPMASNAAIAVISNDLFFMCLSWLSGNYPSLWVLVSRRNKTRPGSGRHWPLP